MANAAREGKARRGQQTAGSPAGVKGVLLTRQPLQVAALADDVRRQVAMRRLTWRQAAEQANELRNTIMTLMRGRSTPVGRAMAERLKLDGKTLNELIASKTQRLYGPKVDFNKLTTAQQNAVYSEIVKSAGKTNPRVSALVSKLSIAGRGLLVISVGLSVYTVATADNNAEAAAREATTTGAGIAGGGHGGSRRRTCMWPRSSRLRRGRRLRRWGIGGDRRQPIVVATSSMRLANELGIRPVGVRGDDVPPRSEILVNGVRTGKHVNGAVLEAAVSTNHWSLLFTTDDIPYEDVLTITLLDVALVVVDRASLGGPYTTGSFKLIELLEPRSVKFRFFGETDWTVEVLPRRQVRVPLVSDPIGVFRRFGWWRRFVVRRELR